MNTYNYTKVVRGFLKLKGLDEKDFLQAVSLSEQMDQLDTDMRNLECLPPSNAVIRKELYEQYGELGRQLVKCFLDYPEFQDALETYNYTDGEQYFIDAASSCKLKWVEVVENTTLVPWY